MIDFSSIKKFSVSSDWNIASDTMKIHERHPQGWPLIKHYMETYFKKTKDFRAYAYTT